MNLWKQRRRRSTRSKIIIQNLFDDERYLEQVYYCMYPFLTRCLVIGVITPEQLITNRPLHQLPFPYQKSDHKNYYKDISLNIHDLYFSSSVILFPIFENKKLRELCLRRQILALQLFHVSLN